MNTPWDLEVFSFNYMEFSLGAGFYITTPLVKKRYKDVEWYRCISLSISFMGFDCRVTVPLWQDVRVEENSND